MYDYMDRSAIKALRKRGKSYSEIAEEMNCDRRTVKKILEEPLDKSYKKGNLEPSQVDIYKEDIFKWLDQEISILRMIELAREDKEKPYKGCRTAFYKRVEKFKKEWNKLREEKIGRAHV